MFCDQQLGLAMFRRRVDIRAGPARCPGKVADTSEQHGVELVPFQQCLHAPLLVVEFSHMLHVNPIMGWAEVEA